MTTAKEHIMKDEFYSLCGRHRVDIGGWMRYAPEEELEKLGVYCKVCLKKYYKQLEENLNESES